MAAGNETGWHQLDAHSICLRPVSQASALATVLRVVLSLRAMVVDPSPS